MHLDDLYLKAKVKLLKRRMYHITTMNNILPSHYKLAWWSLCSMEIVISCCDDDVDLDAAYIHHADIELLKMEAGIDLALENARDESMNESMY